MKTKTHKATAKRFKVTARKKIIRRQTHQDHFNAREKAKKTRAKRKNRSIAKTEKGEIRRLLPHSF